jgi:hypothetical protein
MPDVGKALDTTFALLASTQLFVIAAALGLLHWANTRMLTFEVSKLMVLVDVKGNIFG